MVVNSETTTGKGAEEKTFRCSALNVASVLHTLFLKLGDHHRKGGGKNAVSTDAGKVQGNSVLYTQQGSCTHEVIEVLAACTRLVQAQARFLG